jgi:hypothetical protein
VEPERADRKGGGYRDAQQAHLYVERLERGGTQRPGRGVEEHEQVDPDRDALTDRDYPRADGREPQRARHHRRVEPRVGSPRPQHQQDEARAAHRHGLGGEDQAAQDDVEEARHVTQSAAGPHPIGPAA